MENVNNNTNSMFVIKCRDNMREIDLLEEELNSLVNSMTGVKIVELDNNEISKLEAINEIQCLRDRNEKLKQQIQYYMNLNQNNDLKIKKPTDLDQIDNQLKKVKNSINYNNGKVLSRLEELENKFTKVTIDDNNLINKIDKLYDEIIQLKERNKDLENLNILKMKETNIKDDKPDWKLIKENYLEQAANDKDVFNLIDDNTLINICFDRFKTQKKLLTFWRNIKK